jgi:hypothetical protein
MMTTVDSILRDLKREKAKNRAWSMGVATVILLLLQPVFWFIDGWALCKMWRWFITPTFGVHAPNQWVAVGLMTTAALFLYGLAQTPDNSEKSAGTMIGEAVGKYAIGPVVIVFFGWVIHQFA